MESAGTDRAEPDLTARVWVGSAHAVGRIDFAGHSGINDSTLRRAMTIYERDLLDVRQLRRSLARINDIGVFEPLTLADISVARRDDGVTADLTIPLRERKRRWWSVSGPMFPGIGRLQASVSSRLPPWGRGVFEATTYFVSLNVAGFAKPFLFLTLQRPVIPGQELLSGFAVSPALSPRAMLTHYGRTHLAHRIGAHARCRVERSADGASHVGRAAGGRAARLRTAQATPLVAAPRRSSGCQRRACGADPLNCLGVDSLWSGIPEAPLHSGPRFSRFSLARRSDPCPVFCGGSWPSGDVPIAGSSSAHILRGVVRGIAIARLARQEPVGGVPWLAVPGSSCG